MSVPLYANRDRDAVFRTALIIEDHPLFGDALAMTLRSVSQIQNVTHAESLAHAQGLLQDRTAFDIILLDLNLPDVDGLEGLIALRRTAPQIPILLVTSVDETRVIRASLAAGAAGFVPKHSRRDIFRAAFQALAAGEVYAPDLPTEDELEALPQSGRDAAIRSLSQLTRQQAKILDLICEGKMNKQIAYELAIAETTVKAHVTAIMRKMGVSSRTQAVLMARDANMTGLLSDGRDIS